MRIPRFLNTFVVGFLAATACMILTPIAIASYIGQPMTVVFLPFDPVDEIVMQAAIAREETGASTADEQLKRLRDIEIRTALEDYRRLHYELG